MEEKIDVLDNKGNKTGKIKTKNEVHASGDWHLAVHIWLINERGELLIQRRSKNKENHPNMLDISVAGHASSAESSEQSAMREVQEEIGLKIESGQLNKIGSLDQKSVLNNGTYFNNEFNDIYIVKTNTKVSEMKRQIEEVDELFYLHWKEFEKRVRDGQKDIVPHPNEYNILFAYLENND